MRTQRKFDGIVKGLITMRNRLKGLHEEVSSERDGIMSEVDKAQAMVAALTGLGTRIQESIDELTTIIGDDDGTK